MEEKCTYEEAREVFENTEITVRLFSLCCKVKVVLNVFSELKHLMLLILRR